MRYPIDSDRNISHIVIGAGSDDLAMEQSRLRLQRTDNTPIVFVNIADMNPYQKHIDEFNKIMKPYTAMGFNFGSGESYDMLKENGINNYQNLKAEHLLIESKESKLNRLMRNTIESLYNRIEKRVAKL
jgi:hypothetical protein